MFYYLFVTNGVTLRQIKADEDVVSFLAWANPMLIFFTSEEELPSEVLNREPISASRIL